MDCKICNKPAQSLFTAKVLKKHSVRYFQCGNCDFVFTEKPYWLKEAYRNPINISDTGILARNLYFLPIVSSLIYLNFDKQAKFLDYSSGYGIFTRLMRDAGFDFYWDDPMTQNIFAKTFEYQRSMKIELLTAFECFEHFVHPVVELEKMLKISKNILFSTELIDENNIDEKWWYFGFDHGQHVAFYNEKTFQYLSSKFNLYYYNLDGLGLLTEKKLNRLTLLMIRKYPQIIMPFLKNSMQSLTVPDMNKIHENL